MIGELPVLSYTFLRDFESCPRKAQARYVTKKAKFEETDAMRWGKRVHTALEARIRHVTPLPSELAHFEPLAKSFDPFHGNLGVEMRLGMDEFGKGVDFFNRTDVWFRGVVDVAVIDRGWNFGPKQAVIFDWKTGKVREDAEELELHALLLKLNHPTLEKITGHFVWLGEPAGSQVGQPHELSDTAGKFVSLKQRGDEIEKAAKHDYWPPRQGPLCGWCNVVDCEFNPERAR